jgi:hypothetical protein
MVVGRWSFVVGWAGSIAKWNSTLCRRRSRLPQSGKVGHEIPHSKIAKSAILEWGTRHTRKYDGKSRAREVPGDVF